MNNQDDRGTEARPTDHAGQQYDTIRYDSYRRVYRGLESWIFSFI